MPLTRPYNLPNGIQACVTSIKPDSFRVYKTKNSSATTEYPDSLGLTLAIKPFSPHSFSQVIFGATHFPDTLADISFDFCAKETSEENLHTK